MRFRPTAQIAAVLFPLLLVILPCARGGCAEEIVLAGKIVARISSAGEYESLTQRAAAIDKCIGNAISVENVGAPKMRVAALDGLPAIYVGKTFIMKVYSADAKPYGVTAWQLAKTWARRLGEVLPLAEPCTHMNNAAAASELAREQARAAAAANLQVPRENWAMVEVVLDELARARALPEADFQAQLPTIQQTLYRDIRQCLANQQAAGAAAPVPAHKPGECPEPGGCAACKAAQAAALAGLNPAAPVTVPLAVQRRIVGGLKLLRVVDEERYLRDRVMVAATLCAAVAKTPAK